MGGRYGMDSYEADRNGGRGNPYGDPDWFFANPINMREQVDQVRDIKRELKQVRRARSRIASDRMGGGMGTYYYGGGRGYGYGSRYGTNYYNNDYGYGGGYGGRRMSGGYGYDGMGYGGGGYGYDRMGYGDGGYGYDRMGYGGGGGGYGYDRMGYGGRSGYSLPYRSRNY
eukprot:CAMPEP_0116072612 /NCGR_PEP_ID=MMETSP0322-20121206/14645_1 /TAXON_ID=163516 /ORGANISM="Leptocylindrus danicus var. apora, Strain B651" /LENGTH=169 /DNA_ID=CAMNT_0003561517 /DNA_START=139 /DNA_END=648 /DNA_ORIENTATION=+